MTGGEAKGQPKNRAEPFRISPRGRLTPKYAGRRRRGLRYCKINVDFDMRNGFLDIYPPSEEEHAVLHRAGILAAPTMLRMRFPASPSSGGPSRGPGCKLPLKGLPKKRGGVQVFLGCIVRRWAFPPVRPSTQLCLNYTVEGATRIISPCASKLLGCPRCGTRPAL